MLQKFPKETLIFAMCRGVELLSVWGAAEKMSGTSGKGVDNICKFLVFIQSCSGGE